MKKIIIAAILILLLGVIALEVVTVIKLININGSLPDIQRIK